MNFFDDDQGQASYHDTALICLNGHMINDSIQTYPQHSKKFCDKCGAPTISECPSCKKSIRGQYHVSGSIVLGYKHPTPTFCEGCGKPFPWTETKLVAAKEIADELEGLSPEERERLKGSLDDLIKESPKTEPAKLKFKNVMRKAGAGSIEIMKDALSDVLSETVKKTLFGP